ncbi:hypothetical protein B0H13DRAFT_1874071 [Mycena leptocephala]|nr:hypothetical protein B0H13DRAFT_1874071 [Mycena leptocephala]
MEKNIGWNHSHVCGWPGRRPRAGSGREGSCVCFILSTSGVGVATLLSGRNHCRESLAPLSHASGGGGGGKARIKASVAFDPAPSGNSGHMWALHLEENAEGDRELGVERKEG